MQVGYSYTPGKPIIVQQSPKICLQFPNEFLTGNLVFGYEKLKSTFLNKNKSLKLQIIKIKTSNHKNQKCGIGSIHQNSKRTKVKRTKTKRII